MISYNLESDEVTVYPDAMVAPDFIGPDGLAVVAPSTHEGMFGVYGTDSN